MARHSVKVVFVPEAPGKPSDFQALAIVGGVPMLDSGGSTERALSSWLGDDIVARAEIEQQSGTTSPSFARFYPAGSEGLRLEQTVEPMTLEDLSVHPFYAETFSEFGRRLGEVRPSDEGERELLNRLRELWRSWIAPDVERSGAPPQLGQWFKFIDPATGQWRALWCWGYVADPLSPGLPVRLCDNSACASLFLHRGIVQGDAPRCPHCKKGRAITPIPSAATAIPPTKTRSNGSRSFVPWLIAAGLLLASLAGVYWYSEKKPEPGEPDPLAVNRDHSKDDTAKPNDDVAKPNKSNGLSKNPAADRTVNGPNQRRANSEKSENPGSKSSDLPPPANGEATPVPLGGGNERNPASSRIPPQTSGNGKGKDEPADSTSKAQQLASNDLPSSAGPQPNPLLSPSQEQARQAPDPKSSRPNPPPSTDQGDRVTPDGSRVPGSGEKNNATTPSERATQSSTGQGGKGVDPKSTRPNNDGNPSDRPSGSQVKDKPTSPGPDESPKGANPQNKDSGTTLPSSSGGMSPRPATPSERATQPSTSQAGKGTDPKSTRSNNGGNSPDRPSGSQVKDKPTSSGPDESPKGTNLQKKSSGTSPPKTTGGNPPPPLAIGSAPPSVNGGTTPSRSTDGTSPTPTKGSTDPETPSRIDELKISTTSSERKGETYLVTIRVDGPIDETAEYRLSNPSPPDNSGPWLSPIRQTDGKFQVEMKSPAQPKSPSNTYEYRLDEKSSSGRVQSRLFSIELNERLDTKVIPSPKKIPGK